MSNQIYSNFHKLYKQSDVSDYTLSGINKWSLLSDPVQTVAPLGTITLTFVAETDTDAIAVYDTGKLVFQKNGLFNVQLDFGFGVSTDFKKPARSIMNLEVLRAAVRVKYVVQNCVNDNTNATGPRFQNIDFQFPFEVNDQLIVTYESLEGVETISVFKAGFDLSVTGTY